jgi:sec-independent protein translocase protein TatC
VRNLLPKRLARGETAELVDHLGELRARLFVCVAALAVGGVIGWVVHTRLIEALERALPPEHRRLVTFGVAEPFMTSLKVSLLAGIVLALPVILWQVWSFLAPAFEEVTAKPISSLVGLAAVLAAGGALFGYEVALPAAVGFLTTFDQNVYDIQIRAAEYLSFASLVLFACAIVFELPLFIVALVRLRILDSHKLRRNRRIGYVAVAALAVALPGVDPVTTATEMIPLFILFEAAIWASVLVDRRQPALEAVTHRTR